MNTLRIRELTLQIERLEKELKAEKELALENFRNMSEEDIALCENKIEKDGVVIQYFPKSKTVSVDTAKLKQDGLYEKYSKETNKTDYIKVSVKPIASVIMYLGIVTAIPTNINAILFTSKITSFILNLNLDNA